jgi:molybdenum-dependent DNA-binding transcriptional regulator ModE
MTGDLVSLSIPHPDESIFRTSEKWLEAATAFEIATPEQAQFAGADLRAIKLFTKQVEEKETAITGPINQAHKEVKAHFKPVRDWLAEAERILKGKLLAYQADQERVASEARAKAEAEAAKARERLERKANIAEVLGREERAEELRDLAANQTTGPAIVSAAPKLAGISSREVWSAKITSKLLLVKHIVEVRPDLMALVQIDQTALNAQARSLKDSLELPGVEVISEKIMAARGG